MIVSKSIQQLISECKSNDNVEQSTTSNKAQLAKTEVQRKSEGHNAAICRDIQSSNKQERESKERVRVTFILKAAEERRGAHSS